MIALLEVPQQQIGLYGCAAVEPVPSGLTIPAAAAESVAEVVRVTGLVEKPDPADAPSN